MTVLYAIAAIVIVVFCGIIATISVWILDRFWGRFTNGERAILYIMIFLYFLEKAK